MKPFIHIAGLFRSGTTLVQELLTEQDKSFIFHEPRFGDGIWQFEEHDRRYLRKWGWDPPKFSTIGDTWKWFMEDKGIQIGAKEVRNNGSALYYDSWQGNARLIVVDRDPYDIYMSCVGMMMRSNADFTWRPQYLPLSAINLFREVKPEIWLINKLWDHYYHVLCKRIVDYVDLCNFTGFEDLYTFCESDVTKPDVGGYHAILARGKYEIDKHKGQITQGSIKYEYSGEMVDREAAKFRQLVNREKLWR